MQLFDFLTCAYINFSKNKQSYIKSKEINVVDQNQRSYCFTDLQKEVYPQQFQQAIETVVLLFSSHIGFVLESELKYNNKFLGAAMQMTLTLFSHRLAIWPPRASVIPVSTKPSLTIPTTHIRLLHSSQCVISYCLTWLEHYISTNARDHFH